MRRIELALAAAALATLPVFASALYGREMPGSALNYVWSSREARGARWDNPFSADSKMISVGAGQLGEWITEEVDVWAD